MSGGVLQAQVYSESQNLQVEMPAEKMVPKVEAPFAVVCESLVWVSIFIMSAISENCMSLSEFCLLLSVHVRPVSYSQLPLITITIDSFLQG